MVVDFSAFYTPTSKQAEFHSCPSMYRLIGGAMGGGKSRAGCAEGIQLSLDIPGNRGVIVRKNLTVLKRTTMVTFFQVCPPELIKKYNRTDLIVTLVNGSEISFIEADKTKDPLFDKIKSLEIGWFFIDEANEVHEDAFKILCTRLRWSPANGSYFGNISSNPEDCWVKQRFVDTKNSNYAYIQSLPSDNPHLPKDYVDRMKEVLDDVQIQKYVYANWNVSDDPMRIIPYVQLHNILINEEDVTDVLSQVEGEEALAVDVAELGDDNTVLSHFRGSFLYQSKKYSKLLIPETTNIVRSEIISRGINHNQVGIDAIGVGAGVWGNLTSEGYRVRRLIAGERASSEYQIDMLSFSNAKSQWWWKMRRDIMDADSGLMIVNSKDLVADLLSIRYKIVSEKTIQVESKDAVKARISRSPDEGDAAVMANWVRNTTPEVAAMLIGEERGMFSHSSSVERSEYLFEV